MRNELIEKSTPEDQWLFNSIENLLKFETFVQNDLIGNFLGRLLSIRRERLDQIREEADIVRKRAIQYEEGLRALEEIIGSMGNISSPKVSVRGYDEQEQLRKG